VHALASHLYLYSLPTRRSYDLICMDVIDSAYAPGVSANAVLGLFPHIVLELAKRIIPNEKSQRLVLLKPTLNMMSIIVRQSSQRSEEHTSESSHVSISYAVFCL